MNTQACCRCDYFMLGWCAMRRQDQSPPVCAEPCCCAPGTGLTGTDWVVTRCKEGSAKAFDTSICEEAGSGWLECGAGSGLPTWDSGDNPQPENWLGRTTIFCQWLKVHSSSTEPILHNHCCLPPVAEGESYGYPPDSGGGGGGLWECHNGWVHSFGGFMPVAFVSQQLLLAIQPPPGTAYIACYMDWHWCIPDGATYPRQTFVPTLGGCSPDLLRNCGRGILSSPFEFGFETWFYYFAFFSDQPNCDDLKTSWCPMSMKIHNTYLHYIDPTTGLYTICRSAIPMWNAYRDMEFIFATPTP